RLTGRYWPSEAATARSGYRTLRREGGDPRWGFTWRGCPPLPSPRTARPWQRAGRTARSGCGRAAPGTGWWALRGKQHAVTSVAFTPDGTALAVALHDGGVRVWLAETLKKTDVP